MPSHTQVLDEGVEDCDLGEIFPFTLDDVRVSSDQSSGDESEIIEWKKRNHFADICFGKRKRVKKLESDHDLWNRALSKASSAGDEWKGFDVEGLPTERATRHRYDALDASWKSDDVTIKMEKESFNAGAMRRCFRVKKPTTFTTIDVWRRGNTNYVAKEYITDVPRQTYYDDVKLQMEAKLWGNEYNRHNPPKKVDIVQMCVLELTDRPDRPLFHLEHFIEGNYVKYNSNSGFVLDDNLRLTPQAFTHFTFERSGHELMVVDVQGVGDLYTDPQIHTANGEEYGDGNLGTRGMALFFHSHVCNDLCRCLGLTPFDLAATENSELSPIALKQKLCKTVSRGKEELCVSPREHASDRHDLMRIRSTSSGFHSGDDVTSSLEESSGMMFRVAASFSDQDDGRRARFFSECSTGSNDGGEKSRFAAFAAGLKHNPSNVEAEIERMQAVDQPSILGQIHFDLAKYHEVGRFLPADKSGDYDRKAAFFHLERAEECGVLPAIVTAADIYLGRPHDLLSDLQVAATPDSRRRGMALLLRAAEAGDRTAMVDVARSYDLGTYLPLGDPDRDWSKAVDWYEKAVESESEDAYEDEPGHLLLGRAAEMLKTGGPHLEPDYSRAAEMFTSAAEKASANMKGRAANKYFMAAEECWGMCDDDE